MKSPPSLQFRQFCQLGPSDTDLIGSVLNLFADASTEPETYRAVKASRAIPPDSLEHSSLQSR
jgi:hypothetical protein